MFKVSKSELIDAPPERVFAFLADLRQHAAWHQSFDMKVTDSSEGEPRVGYQAQLEGAYRDQPMLFRLEMTEFDSPSRISFRQVEVNNAIVLEGDSVMRGRGHGTKTKESAYRISYDFEPAGQGTRLTRSSEPAGWWWTLPAYLVWPVVQPIRLSNQTKVLKMIKSEIETASP